MHPFSPCVTCASFLPLATHAQNMHETLIPARTRTHTHADTHHALVQAPPPSRIGAYARPSSPPFPHRCTRRPLPPPQPCVGAHAGSSSLTLEGLRQVKHGRLHKLPAQRVGHVAGGAEDDAVRAQAADLCTHARVYACTRVCMKVCMKVCMYSREHAFMDTNKREDLLEQDWARIEVRGGQASTEALRGRWTPLDAPITA